LWEWIIAMLSLRNPKSLMGFVSFVEVPSVRRKSSNKQQILYASQFAV
jgi:hypothetical protein